jgi:predicted pyridoxine 5'-phosphate oxidase superfamily flavin-nucleotide-binding protein
LNDQRTQHPGCDGERQMQHELGTRERAERFYDDQVRDRLNKAMREFVARQEMFFLATADAKGNCDNSFRAGPPGFVQVLSERSIAYPEYRGNGVLASLGNIRENAHVGILMIDFTRDRIGLHVNGRARQISDELMRIRHADLPVDSVPGRRPQVWVVVDIDEAYIHCSKHIPHLVRAGFQGADGRAWGTDDVKRKGGDFFGAAAESRAARAEVTDDATARADHDQWRREAERALERARRGRHRDPADGSDDDATPSEPEVQPSAFRGWFG